MMIIGCDYHPSWQQICWVETATAPPAKALKMIVGSASYPVRSQNWTATGTSIGHGTIQNLITSPGTGSDVSAPR